MDTNKKYGDIFEEYLQVEVVEGGSTQVHHKKIDIELEVEIKAQGAKPIAKGESNGETYRNMLKFQLGALLIAKKEIGNLEHKYNDAMQLLMQKSTDDAKRLDEFAKISKKKTDAWKLEKKALEKEKEALEEENEFWRETVSQLTKELALLREYVENEGEEASAEEDKVGAAGEDEEGAAGEDEEGAAGEGEEGADAVVAVNVGVHQLQQKMVSPNAPKPDVDENA